LKRDVLLETIKFNGEIFIHDEDANGSLEGFWQKVTSEQVQTSHEMFNSVFENAPVTAEYHRNPITDEQAPLPSAVDVLLGRLMSGDNWKERYIIFNCQMGRGRTTTGMVIASLWSMHVLGLKIHEVSDKVSTGWSPDLVRQSSDNKSDKSDLSPEKAALLQNGYWKVVGSLVRLLDNGEAVKTEVDRIIDLSAGMQNLRQAVYDVQVMALTALPRRRPGFIARGKLYLQRYFYLIVLNSYLRQAAPKLEQPFEQWLGERPEITNLLAFDHVDGLLFPEV
jgi:hypothetical protein